MKDKISKFISDGRLDKALDALADFYKGQDQELETASTLLKARYKQWLREKNLGLIQDDSERRRIEFAILEIISEDQNYEIQKNKFNTKLNINNRHWLFITITLVIATGIIFSIIYYLNKKDSFEDFAGLYSGTLEGVKFEICFKKYGDDIIGTMYFVDFPETYYVNYKGKINKTSNQIELKYQRNYKHPNGPDQGIAIISGSDEKGFFTGYWESETISENRAEWKFKKVSSDCQLLNWDG